MPTVLCICYYCYPAADPDVTTTAKNKLVYESEDVDDIDRLFDAGLARSIIMTTRQVLVIGHCKPFWVNGLTAWPTVIRRKDESNPLVAVFPSCVSSFVDLFMLHFTTQRVLTRPFVNVGDGKKTHSRWVSIFNCLQYWVVHGSSLIRATCVRSR